MENGQYHPDWDALSIFAGAGVRGKRGPTGPGLLRGVMQSEGIGEWGSTLMLTNIGQKEYADSA